MTNTANQNTKEMQPRQSSSGAGWVALVAITGFGVLAFAMILLLLGGIYALQNSRNGRTTTTTSNGIKGDKGDRGETGATGPAGQRGPRGPRGRNVVKIVNVAPKPTATPCPPQIAPHPTTVPSDTRQRRVNPDDDSNIVYDGPMTIQGQDQNDNQRVVRNYPNRNYPIVVTGRDPRTTQMYPGCPAIRAEMADWQVRAIWACRAGR